MFQDVSKASMHDQSRVRIGLEQPGKFASRKFFSSFVREWTKVVRREDEKVRHLPPHGPCPGRN